MSPSRRDLRPRAKGTLRLLLSAFAVASLALAGVAAPAPAHALTWRAPLCSEFVGCNAAGLSNAGYQGVYTQSFWYMYGGHNCTNYVAYRLQQDGIARFVRAGHGNAWQWGSEARLAGIAVDKKTPRPGDVAWWDKSAIGGIGHVAYVESVNAAAGTFTVSEDNLSSTFDWRVYRIDEVSGFIRVAKPQITAPATVSIVGTARAGSTLTASTGTWAPADVSLTYRWLRDGVFIPGATGRTYKLESADAGRSISMQVTASKTGYSKTARLSPAVAVAAGTLSATQKPAITGTPEAGQTLTTIRGSWQPSGVSYAYQWLRDGVPIAGARSKTYKLTTADAGRAVSVRVTGTKAGFAALSLTSPATTVSLLRFTATQQPVADGDARVGATLSAIRGSWSPAGIAYSYQWTRDGHAIAGATSKMYVVTPADAGRSVAVHVTGSKTAYETTTLRSPDRAIALQPLTRTQVPVVQGEAVIGGRLTAIRGTWSPTGLSYRYEWLRAGTPIPGATSKDYAVTAADAGSTIAVRVTAVKAGYQPTSLTSAARAVPLKPLTRTVTPRVDGQARIGQTLTAVRGTWSPSGLHYTYQWFRGGTPIAGATTKTYTLSAADRGQRISVRVTAAKTGYVSTSLTSAATPAIR
jgi:surface antigen